MDDLVDRMVPARQDLETDDVARLQIDQRLVVGNDFIMFQCSRQLAGKINHVRDAAQSSENCYSAIGLGYELAVVTMTLMTSEWSDNFEQAVFVPVPSKETPPQRSEKSNLDYSSKDRIDDRLGFVRGIKFCRCRLHMSMNGSFADVEDLSYFPGRFAPRRPHQHLTFTGRQGRSA